MMADDAQLIAKDRIKILFDLAEKNFKSNPERAQRYVTLARKIASRNRVRLPKNLRRNVCHNCKSYINSSNSRIRIRQKREPHIAITCLNCGHISRIPLRRKKT